MSRTKKGGKGLGWEIWSRRPCGSDTSGGRFVKKRTHKAERRQAKRELRGIDR